MNEFTTLTGSSNPLIALLASIAIVLSGVVVYQWNFTSKQTVPRWIYDQLFIELSKNTDSITQILTTLRERGR